MKHASFPATEIATSTIIPFPRKKPQGLFASILDALHYSRRLQARRVLGQYRHLIERAELCALDAQKGRAHVDR